MEGRVEFVEDFEEKERCMKVMMHQYSNLEFKFSVPAIKNVGVIKVSIEKITAKEFGTKVVKP